MRCAHHRVAQFFSLFLVALVCACRSPGPATDQPRTHDEPSTERKSEQVAVVEEAVAEEIVDDPMVSTDTLLPAPPDYALQRIGTPDYPVPPYAKYLKGVRICLDPGHGGDAAKRGFKRGPTGVREAEMNLRVAQYLRDLLEHVEAEVRLVREEDVDLSLEARANVATEWGADLFISCHHNAVGKPEVNYTTVWHHADVDYRPANLDLARHLCRGLMQSLDFEQITAVPLKSDQLMYAGGFAVLRHAQVTAALCESSFFTNPEEEQRLRDPEHNLREAYGMFLGLAWYAYGGLPRARLIEPEDGVLRADGERRLVFELDDGLRARGAWGAERQMVFSDTIAVRLNGARLPHSFTNEGYVLTADLPDELTVGEHAVTVHFANMFKNSVINPHFVLTIE